MDNPEKGDERGGGRGTERGKKDRVVACPMHRLMRRKKGKCSEKSCMSAICVRYGTLRYAPKIIISLYETMS